MILYLSILISVILIFILFGLARVFRGPNRPDRMLAAQLCGTGSVAIFVLLFMINHKRYLLDVALTFSILIAVSSIAFVRLCWHKPDGNVEEK